MTFLELGNIIVNLNEIIYVEITNLSPENLPNEVDVYFATVNPDNRLPGLKLHITQADEVAKLLKTLKSYKA